MVSFQAKIDWGRPRKGDNKNYRSVQTRNIKFQKIAEQFRKLKKYHYSPISSHNRLEKAEKERKLKLSFRFVPTQHEIENSKKIAKKFKKLKNTIMASFRAIIGWRRSRKRDNENYRSNPFLTDP